MSKMYISNAKESIRLFKNPALDALSYVHWSYPLIFWLPIVGFCLYKAVNLSGDHLAQLLLFFSGGVFYAASAGFLVGYLAYDMIHYAIHRAPLRHPIWKRLQKHHMVHHYHDSNRGFGVSSVIWDKVYGTLFPKDRGERSTC